MKDDPPLVLELVQLELYLTSADLVASGFQEAVSDGLDAIGGSLLFTARIEDDPLFQRCAAVVVGEEEDQAVGLVFLSLDGLTATVLDASASDHPISEAALAAAGRNNMQVED